MHQKRSGLVGEENEDGRMAKNAVDRLCFLLYTENNIYHMEIDHHVKRLDAAQIIEIKINSLLKINEAILAQTLAESIQGIANHGQDE